MFVKVKKDYLNLKPTLLEKAQFIVYVSCRDPVEVVDEIISNL